MESFVIKRAVLVLCLLAIGFSAMASGRCTAGTEFEPPLCPLKLPKVKRITITDNAAKSPAEPDASVSCEHFRINENHVRRFLSRAKTASARDAHYTLDWTPCYAAGEIEFEDGRKGRWSVDQFRSGSLSFDNTQDALTLYCPSCRFAPFQW
jgi:hypothetical protein